jgi:phospholipid-binding lipoprotein MlaA
LNKSLRLCLVCAAALLAGGCASVPTSDPDDPLEKINRPMFKFNERLDKWTTRPLAKVWVWVAPKPVRAWAANFFGNLADPWIGVNNLLQGKPADALNDWMRFVFNSTLGLGGLLDIASEAGMPKHDEDFGQTLAVWGVPDGIFVVLPVLGPRTLRDAAAAPVDLVADSYVARELIYHDNIRERNAFIGGRAVSARSQYLGIERTLNEGTLDKYRFARDFYRQQRRAKIYDGNPLHEYEDFDAPDDGDDQAEQAAAPQPEAQQPEPQQTGEEP